MKAADLRAAARGLALVLVTSCGGETVMVPEEPRATSMSISPSSVDFDFLRQTRSLVATVLDQSGDRFTGAVTWSTNDATVASVTAVGLVAAVGNGSTEVVAAVGGVTARVTVTVAQVATRVVVVSGDAQEALAGSALANPIVAVAWDVGNSPVPGTTVTFSPDSGHGSVSASPVLTDANGEVVTIWTLGVAFGPQRLVASIAGSEVAFTARAGSDTPTPDLVPGGPLIVARSDPTTLEAVVVTTTVRNEGDGDTGSGFRVQLLDDGVEIATADFAPLVAGGEEAVEFAAGPFTAGLHALSLVVDADDALVELDETNNQADRNLVVALQAPVSAESPLTNLSGAAGSELLFRLVIPPGSPSTLTVELGGGFGDVDLFVEGDPRPPSRNQYNDCVSAGPTASERCQIVSASGTYHIVLLGSSPYSGTTLFIGLGNTTLPFDIDVVMVNGTAEQEAAVLAAADRWMNLILGDIPDIDFSTNPLPADFCFNGQPGVNRIIDDVRIYVSFVSIDGPMGILASAGPCVVRAFTFLPIVGVIRFDADDLVRLEADGDMEEVMLHEIGHVLGVGSIWQVQGLLENPSLPDDQGADTHFAGPLAIEAFDAAGGAAYTAGAKVPVENLAGPGSADGHWRESVLDLELMTPFLDSNQLNALSAITVQSLADLGYGVDVGQADAFSLVLPALRRAPAAGRRIIDLRGDVRTGPIVVVDRKGRVVQVRR